MIRNELRQLRNVTCLVFNASKMLDPRQISRLEGPGGGPEQMQMWKMLNYLSNSQTLKLMISLLLKIFVWKVKVTQLHIPLIHRLRDLFIHPSSLVRMQSIDVPQSPDIIDDPSDKSS